MKEFYRGKIRALEQAITLLERELEEAKALEFRTRFYNEDESILINKKGGGA